MAMEFIGKILIFLGILMTVFGIALIYLDKLPIKIGSLPGDIFIKDNNFTLYIPITTSILVSVIISIILFVLSKVIK